MPGSSLSPTLLQQPVGRIVNSQQGSGSNRDRLPVHGLPVTADNNTPATGAAIVPERPEVSKSPIKTEEGVVWGTTTNSSNDFNACWFKTPCSLITNHSGLHSGSSSAFHGSLKYSTVGSTSSQPDKTLLHPAANGGLYSLVSDQWLEDIPDINRSKEINKSENISKDYGSMEEYSPRFTLGPNEVRFEQYSPSINTLYTGINMSTGYVRRTSSTSSVTGICSSASSAHNSDDEDSDGKTKSNAYKERRRSAHTHAEQKRRDAIKRGYDDLQSLVPTCQQDTVSSQKLSKAAILQKSIDYINYSMNEKKKKEAELEELRKEVMALKIMKENYEAIVNTHQNTPDQGQEVITDEMKFQVFHQIMDGLFHSFNDSISTDNFGDLSSSVFRWLEANCKPQTLREMTIQILQSVNNP